MAKKTTTPSSTSGIITKEMTLDFDGLMRILANSLYSEKKVFIRELVQRRVSESMSSEEVRLRYEGRAVFVK